MRRLLPDAFDLSEPGGEKLPYMLVDPVEEPVAIQEPPFGSQKIVDRPITREDVVGAWQVVEHDRGHREIKRPSNLLRP